MIKIDALICPVCGDKLIKKGKSFFCENGHCFDIAKEGYLNLLTGSKSGSGDSPEMAKARKRFLEKGYYSFLAEKMSCFLPDDGVVCDACCGEGYYTNYFARKRADLSFYGFDLSKKMTALAAKSGRLNKANPPFYFVSNISSVPLASNSVNSIMHICAPVNAGEFSRMLSGNGLFISAMPGKEHLIELKEKIYSSPRKNDPDKRNIDFFRLKDIVTAEKKIIIDNNEDIIDLFSMTPYRYKTSRQDAEKLKNLDSIEVTAQFVIRIFEKEK